jgi:tetratricopeptide (TPR) repeat protein
MQLGFWGWTGKRTDIGSVVKPAEFDKNVMPYELADYVNSNTNFKAIVRYGGTIDMVKRVVAAGFPVLVEKGVYFPEATTGRVSWMGHYNIVLGYDDAKQQLITHDSFLQDGKFKHFGYDELKQQWRSFDYTFLIVYPAEKWDALAEALGPYADEAQSYTQAQSIATDEIGNTTGVDHFFAMFNRATNLVKLQDFSGAASVYDEAYQFYASLPEQTRPYRMTWYQTGPYFAYYYAGRYQDVINLAKTTLASTNEPYLEESYYWRARAETMLGQRDLAVKDLCTSLTDHPQFAPSVSALNDLGGATCK